MAGTRQDRRLGLQRLAFSQAGYVTAAQARNLDYSYQAQKYHVDSGNWLRVDRGLFRLPDWPPAPEDQWVRWTLWSNGRGVVSTIRRRSSTISASSIRAACTCRFLSSSGPSTRQS